MNRTTINLRLDRNDKVCEFAEAFSLHPQQIIKVLLKKVIFKIRQGRFFKCLVSYQPDHPGYEPFHITFSDSEYDRNFDVKKIFRISISYLVAIAIELYLDDFEVKEAASYPPITTTKNYCGEENRHMYEFCLEIYKESGTEKDEKT